MENHIEWKLPLKQGVLKSVKNNELISLSRYTTYKLDYIMACYGIRNYHFTRMSELNQQVNFFAF